MLVKRGGARPAAIAGNENVVGMSLGDARGNRADAHFRDQLDADPCGRIGVLQVEDELGEIFDRIDVVVRRRADQADAGSRVPHGRDHLVDLAAGELSPFAGLGPLGDLDLQLVGVGQIPACDAEAARRDLLDRRSLGIAVGQRLEAGVVFPSFARVALAAQAVHGDGQRFVRFGGDRAEAHRAGAESLDDLGGRFDLVEGNRACLF